MNKSFLILFILFPLLGAAAQDGLALLHQADQTLFPQNAEFKWNLTVKRSGETDRVNKFLCWKKGDQKYLFFTVAPQASYGQASLRVENTIWTYMPLADETIKTSYRSAFLNSDLSYADIMYNELALYYDARILSQDEAVVTLELKAKPGADGYDRIVTQIDRTTHATLQREYYSKSGQLLRRIVFSELEFADHQVSHMKLTVTQPLLPQQSTVAEFFDIHTKKDISDRNFTVNYAKNFQTKERW